MYRKSGHSRAAPNDCSARAATFVSRSRYVGSPSAASRGAAIGMSWNSGPRFGGSMITPRQGSIGPGLETPTPAMAPARLRGARARDMRRASTQASTTASGPFALGVSVAIRATRLPSGRITAARTWVPPRSRARTGRADRANLEVGSLGGWSRPSAASRATPGATTQRHSSKGPLRDPRSRSPAIARSPDPRAQKRKAPVVPDGGLRKFLCPVQPPILNTFVPHFGQVP